MPLRTKPNDPKKTGAVPCRLRMTIAIAARCQSGVLLYADKKIVASDGATTEGCKIYKTSLTDDGFLALASATADAIAAEALARRILDDAKMITTPIALEAMMRQVEQSLTEWCQPYAANELPSIQFLMAIRVTGQAALFLIEPRNKIIPIPLKRSIGAGGRIVDAMIDAVFPDDLIFVPKVALLNMAYLARRAKDEELNVGGGSKSNAIYVPDYPGKVKWIDEAELWTAEELASTVDGELSNIRRFMMGLGTIGPNSLAARYGKLILVMAKSLQKRVTFESLDE